MPDFYKLSGYPFLETSKQQISRRQNTAIVEEDCSILHTLILVFVYLDQQSQVADFPQLCRDFDDVGISTGLMVVRVRYIHASCLIHRPHGS
jgi:hypothetical protein